MNRVEDDTWNQPEKPKHNQDRRSVVLGIVGFLSAVGALFWFHVSSSLVTTDVFLHLVAFGVGTILLPLQLAAPIALIPALRYYDTPGGVFGRPGQKSTEICEKPTGLHYVALGLGGGGTALAAFNLKIYAINWIGWLFYGLFFVLGGNLVEILLALIFVLLSGYKG
jgi:hypothetical protein